MKRVSVIIPAAGAAQRFGAGRNKIFEPIEGDALFVRSIRLFAGRPDVCQILLVVANEDRATIEAEHGSVLSELNVQLVAGGVDRTGSVRNGLSAVTDDADLICVHDAARPCVRPEQIDAVFAAAAEHGAAILAWPIHGTIKRASDHVIVETVDRNELWQAQTPQVFRRDWLIDAYADGASATDEAALVERTGRPVRLVEGDPRNIKITTPADLDLARAAIRSFDSSSEGRKPCLSSVGLLQCRSRWQDSPMKKLLTSAVIAVFLTGCNAGGSNGDVHDQFRSNVKVGISSLEYRFADLDPQTAERSGQCRQLLFELLALPQNDAESAYLSDKLAETLAEGDTFQMYDRWLLLLGQDQLVNHPPGSPDFLHGLAKKIDVSREPNSPWPYRTVYASLAVGFLMRATDYSGRVDTYNDELNSAQWERFHRWLTDHRGEFIHDETIGKFRPSSQLPGAQTPAERS
ncbi:MAG: 2-C-methyl-D-erythritol 4-phosphate cytidylyltransferase [Planctomycetota bacterium]|jgi:2-C-methyl-D-erythritol 4-phosphate cytidylyltransferase